MDLDEKKKEQMQWQEVGHSLLDEKLMVVVVAVLLCCPAYLDSQVKQMVERPGQRQDKAVPLRVQVAACLAWEPNMVNLQMTLEDYC